MRYNVKLRIMKKTVMLLTAGLFLLVSSCKDKKEDKPEDAKSKISGTWNLDFVAADENMNNEIDASEKDQISSYLNQTNFKEDGTGLSVFQDSVQDPIDSSYFRYTFTDNDTKFILSDLDGSNPESFEVNTCTNDEFIISQTDTDGIDSIRLWLGFKR